MFAAKLLRVFTAIRENPALLRQSLPAMRNKLHSQGNPAAQGTGNQPTDQEASFAAVLEQEGFAFCPNKVKLPTQGLYYHYQLNGSQKSIDFQAFEASVDKKIHHMDIDLKHTTSDVFFLNDGWFHPNVVYVVTWNKKTSEPRKKITTEAQTFVAKGEDIPTAEESAFVTAMNEVKKTYNTGTKKVGNLSTYMRSANRYGCAGFTPECSETCFQKLFL